MGFRNAGFRPELAIDINPAAVTTYQDNHPQATAIQLDIARVSCADIIDLWQKHIGSSSPAGIIGGPPCQAFSSSNVHQSDDDPRRRLLEKYAGIIHEFSSSLGLDFFVFENVPGLTSKHYESYFDQFEQMCDRAGFKVEKTVIDAGSFGIPQHRKRLIVVGTNKKRFPGVHFRLPEGGKQPTPVHTVLKGLPEPSYCIRGQKENWDSFHANHVTMVPRSPKFNDGSLKPGNSRGLSFKVLDWDSPSYTVAYGHNEIHIHPGCQRRLSIYEAMLLQGFPHEYRLRGTFTQQVQMVSDAVPPPLGEGIARAVAYNLGYARSSEPSFSASIQASLL